MSFEPIGPLSLSFPSPNPEDLNSKEISSSPSSLPGDKKIKPVFENRPSLIGHHTSIKTATQINQNELEESPTTKKVYFVAATVLIVIFSPVILLALSLFWLGSHLSYQYLFASKETMKHATDLQTESNQKKSEGFIKAAQKTILLITDKNIQASLKKSKNTLELQNQHVRSYLARYCVRHDISLNKATLDQIDSALCFFQGNTEHLFNDLPLKIQQSLKSHKALKPLIARSIEETRIVSRSDKNEFKKALDSLKQHLEKPPQNESHLEWNIKTINLLRTVLSSKVYQNLKHDFSNPLIANLQAFAASNWMEESGVMDTFSEFSKKIIVEETTEEAESTQIGDQLEFSELDSSDNSTKESSESESITSKSSKKADILKTTYKKVSQEAPEDHGVLKKIGYAMRQPENALSSLASTQGKATTIRFFTSLIYGSYDGYGRLGNKGFPIMETKYGLSYSSTDKGSFVTCSGGSPTIDNAVTPEFLAVLQGAENRQLYEILSHSDIDYQQTPHFVSYNNLQKIMEGSNGGEHTRSLVLSRLNFEFPLSCESFTFDKDSAFHKMSDLFKEKSTINIDEHFTKTEDPRLLSWNEASKNEYRTSVVAQYLGIQEEDAEYLLQHEITDEILNSIKEEAVAFSLNNRDKNNASGCYFHAQTDKDAKKWIEFLKVAIKIADECVTNIEMEKEEPSQKDLFSARKAYKETVYYALREQAHLHNLTTLQERGIQAPKGMAINACKENIDRGASENAGLGAMQIDDGIHSVNGFIQGRALDYRERFVIKDRFHDLEPFVRQVDPVILKQQMLIHTGIEIFGAVSSSRWGVI